eukprot:5026597-Amphidinium_carterae.1
MLDFALRPARGIPMSGCFIIVMHLARRRVRSKTVIANYFESCLLWLLFGMASDSKFTEAVS